MGSLASGSVELHSAGSSALFSIESTAVPPPRQPGAPQLLIHSSLERGMATSMTTPAAPTATPEQIAAFEQSIGHAAMAISPTLTNLDPHVATMALLRLAGVAAQATQYPRELLAQWTIKAYDDAKQAMQPGNLRLVMEKMGLNPDEPPPADIHERLAKFMKDQLTPPASPPAVG